MDDENEESDEIISNNIENRKSTGKSTNSKKSDDSY